MISYEKNLFHNPSAKLVYHTEKKDLIESKKMICLNDFLWFKEMICLNEIKFVWFKQNIFEPNKYLFESNNFLLWIKQIISLTIYQCINFFVLKKNLFDSNKYLFGSKIFCLNKTNFISFKQIISLNQRKSSKQIIFFDSIKSFFSV